MKKRKCPDCKGKVDAEILVDIHGATVLGEMVYCGPCRGTGTRLWTTREMLEALGERLEYFYMVDGIWHAEVDVTPRDHDSPDPDQALDAALTYVESDKEGE